MIAPLELFFKCELENLILRSGNRRAKGIEKIKAIKKLVPLKSIRPGIQIINMPIPK